MKKRFLLLVTILALSLTACGGSGNDKKMVEGLLKKGAEVLAEKGYTDIYTDAGLFIFRPSGDNTLVSTYLYYFDESVGLCSTAVVGEFNKGNLINFEANNTMNLYDETDGVVNPEDSVEYLNLKNSSKEGNYHPFSDEELSEICIESGVKIEEELNQIIATEMAQEYVLNLMRVLKNPYSIEIHKIYVVLGNNNYISVDFSAENSFGGSVTSVYGNRMYNSIPYKNYKEALASDSSYYKEDCADAKSSGNAISVDAEAVQAYVLENYR